MAKSKVFVRSPFNYDRDEVSRETGLCDAGEDMCRQSFRDDCDINVIVKRFGLTGLMPQGVRVPNYGMFDGVSDFHSAMNAVAEARESFEAMPAEIRARFQNDPGKFVEFCSDEKNLDEMRKMGLAVPAVLEDTSPAPVVASGKEKGNVVDSQGGAGKADKAGSGSAAVSDGDKGGS